MGLSIGTKRRYAAIVKRNLPKFIESKDLNPFKYGRGSLYKDWSREANREIIKDVWAKIKWGCVSTYHLIRTGLRAPSSTRIKNYQVGWKDVIIAFLLGLLLALSHSTHAQSIGGDQVAHNTTKPLKPFKQPVLKPQSRIASVYIAPPTPTPVTGCGNDPYMAYIYQRESGCNTASVNSIGCAGLGQACPGSKLPCGLSDWTCQDNYFRDYAINTYGSTYQAMLAWMSKGWW